PLPPPHVHFQQSLDASNQPISSFRLWPASAKAQGESLSARKRESGESKKGNGNTDKESRKARVPSWIISVDPRLPSRLLRARGRGGALRSGGAPRAGDWRPSHRSRAGGTDGGPSRRRRRTSATTRRSSSRSRLRSSPG